MPLSTEIQPPQPSSADKTFRLALSIASSSLTLTAISGTNALNELEAAQHAAEVVLRLEHAGVVGATVEAERQYAEESKQDGTHSVLAAAGSGAVAAGMLFLILKSRRENDQGSPTPPESVRPP